MIDTPQLLANEIYADRLREADARRLVRQVRDARAAAARTETRDLASRLRRRLGFPPQRAGASA